MGRRLFDASFKRMAIDLFYARGSVKEVATPVFNYFNTFNVLSFNNGAYNANNSSFNPLDKLMEVMEKNKRLYERLLESEREKVELLKGSRKE